MHFDALQYKAKQMLQDSKIYSYKHVFIDKIDIKQNKFQRSR